MIRPLNTMQLSSAKPRTGLQSIGELIPRLIRQYEMQAEMMRSVARRNDAIPAPVVNIDGGQEFGCEFSSKVQATFGWD
ncbi:MAG: hypothetical protein AAF456_13505 [Planctomycetota bacterium]